MLERQPIEATPSVYFNFDHSNQKTNQINLDKEYIPYDYSFSTNKHQVSIQKNMIQNVVPGQYQFATPPSYLRNDICKKLLSPDNQLDVRQQNDRQKIKNISVKLNTEQFFDQFDENFVVNFGDSPSKNQNHGEFRKTFESCPGVNNIKDSNSSKMCSNISEPLARRLSIQGQEPQNQQDYPQLLPKESNKQKTKIAEELQQKQNKAPNQVINQKVQKSKLSYDIRKRIVLKNSDKMNQVNKKKDKNMTKIINYDNLLIVTSSGWDRWTDMPKGKKAFTGANSQPIKKSQKQLKKVQSNVFTTRHIFKQTLRSTTLDSWKKKYTQHKNQLDLKHKTRPHNIFQRPFSLIR